MDKVKILIVGGGFVGINAAKILSKSKKVQLTLIDKSNHHLFQPLLYQVAVAGLSPAEIAVPIRGLFTNRENTNIVQDEILKVNLSKNSVSGSIKDYDYDYLILGAGSTHNYFGNEHWESRAPGLKTLSQATEIRRRIMTAFEKAEVEDDVDKRKNLLTFVVVGGGPTGVELAGAIGEMTRFTLARDFRKIDPTLTRIILVEAGSRILCSFDPSLSRIATRDLESLGVQVWTNSLVSKLDNESILVGKELISSATVLWAAGTQASELGKSMNVELDDQGRVKV